MGRIVTCPVTKKKYERFGEFYHEEDCPYCFPKLSFWINFKVFLWDVGLFKRSVCPYCGNTLTDHGVMTPRQECSSIKCSFGKLHDGRERSPRLKR